VARRVALQAAALAAVASAVVGLVIVQVLLRDDADRQRIMWVAVAGGAATVICVALGTVAIVNRVLVRSLRDLTTALGSAEKGQWIHVPKTTRADEIGDLLRAFDRLSSQVTDLSVAVIDSDRELAWTRRELRLKEALALLFETTQSINEQVDLEAIIHGIPAKVGPALGFDEMAILLYDEARREFVVRATYGFPEGEGVEGVSFARDDVIAGKVADTGEPLVIANTATDPRYSHFKGRHPQDGAFACVPMRLHKRLIGMFNVLRPGTGSIGDGDVRLLTSLASYTALAIAHAESTVRLRDLTVTDELTGVANRRALMMRADQEIERARRGAQPLAALMVDLDHFKSVNDELGHLAGDEVLKAVAATLATGLRTTDVLARWGGEEFVVLLPETARAAAMVVGEKLRAAVAAARPGGATMTISVGCAVYPDDLRPDAGRPGADQALVDAADHALLHAKRSGRDRVVSVDALGRVSG
jgi:diguanylate cyclase (GGDEF)-like protein